MSSATASTAPVLLPQKGTARVKNVMSGDTVILWGKAAAPHLSPPQVQFTLDGLMAPRYVVEKKKKGGQETRDPPWIGFGGIGWLV